MARRRDARRNPARPHDPEAAVELYEGFQGLEPNGVERFDASIQIPRRAVAMGKAMHVLYRSGKVDPETDRLPRTKDGTQDYIHEHDAGVILYEPARARGAHDAVDVDDLEENDTLVMLGQCLGLAYRDGDGEEWDLEFRPGDKAELFSIRSGRMLLVVCAKREIRYLIWGGALGVEPRGIVG